LVGAIARIAGILHLAEHGPDAGPRTAVTAETIRSAYRVGSYFTACAINAFTEMAADHVTADAVYLLERIGQLGEKEVSERDLHVATRSRFKKKADLLPALDRLVEHGYLLPLPIQSSGSQGGRPPAPRYKVHASAQNAHNTHNQQ
jgi:replicative DNA helicase